MADAAGVQRLARQVSRSNTVAAGHLSRAADAILDGDRGLARTQLTAAYELLARPLRGLALRRLESEHMAAGGPLDMIRTHLAEPRGGTRRKGGQVVSDEWVAVGSAAAQNLDGEQVTGRDRYGQEHRGRLDARRAVVCLAPGREVAVQRVHLSLNPGRARDA